ncbi:MAG: antibiotic biosynthesis monooxygenase [Chitinophagaceae bacterium]
MLKLFLITTSLIFSSTLMAQNKSNYIRIARLVIDSTKLDDYKKALQEHAKTAVKFEPGVIMLYAVYEKEHPANVSVFEIYASEEAYQFHIKQPHFLKYKETVKDMVKSLQLIDVSPIALESKAGNHD